MSDITITIHGGNNQILPNATEAIQNFYVGEYCGETSLEEGDGRSGLMPETIRFRAYINKEEDLERYLAQIVECRTVTEFTERNGTQDRKTERGYGFNSQEDRCHRRESGITIS